MSAASESRTTRYNQGILQFLERPALRWLSERMPDWVTPDRLTAFGFIGGLVAALGYAFSANDARFLWLASLGIALNWFGDSLDGTLARVRRIERPNYGFFVDNTTDILEYAIFAIGFGLSGYVRWELALGALAAFYMMMLLGLLKLRVTGIFQISFGGLGLTEIRGIFILVNAAMYFKPPKPFPILGIITTYPNVISVAWIAVQILTFLVVMFRTLHELRIRDQT